VVAAVGEVEAWEQGIALVRPGGEVNLHGGPAAGAELRLPAAPLHYGEVTLQASYHHTPHAVRVALALIATGDLPFPELLGPAITLEDVPAVLRAGGPKRPVAP
jgi:L-iditol 2-dehydrogenase